VAEAASNALERAHLFEQVQRANQQLERLAITDGLTRLYNHRYFMQRLEEEFHRAVRYRLPLSCILFDVDDFKRINDTFGHLKGDQVLREIADRTSRCVRRTDLLARYGGEEFVVLLPQTDLEGARIEADRLREHISDKPYAGLPSDWRITVSIGVSTLRHEYMRLAEDILRAADLALYHSKTTGKDRVSFHEEVEHSP
jgi:two-component system cell cycle response regulator